jgi:hypothetical protein
MSVTAITLNEVNAVREFRTSPPRLRQPQLLMFIILQSKINALRGRTRIVSAPPRRGRDIPPLAGQEGVLVHIDAVRAG